MHINGDEKSAAQPHISAEQCHRNWKNDQTNKVSRKQFY